MKKKMIIIMILVNTIFIIIFYNFYNLVNKYRDYEKETTHNYTAESVTSVKDEIKVPIQSQTQKQYPKEEIIKEYKGYEVCARLQELIMR